MGLSQLKAKASIKAVRLFTNRESAIESFNRVMAEYENSNILKVLSFYGVGGIGKTHLLAKFSRKLKESDNYFIASVDVESPHYNSLIDILLDIRSQLDINATLFDYSIARFHTISGRSLKEIKKAWISEDSLLFDLQELASDLAEVVAPARLIKKLYGIADSRKKRYLSQYKEYFDHIDTLSPGELVTYIPHYLGLAIHNAPRENKFVVFIDTLESLDKRSLFKVTKEDPDAWLSEMIGSAETGVFVIAGRNYIKWGDRNPEWRQHLEQHSLGALSSLDAEYFLKNIPIPDEDIRKAIINSANGLPLYLDLCATTYLIKKCEEKIINAEDFDVHEDEVIKRFLAHLDVEHRESIKAMSVLSVFDYKLFSAVVDSLNINFPLSLFQEFCDSAYTNSIGVENDKYSIHSLIRSYLHDECSIETASIILACVFQEMGSSIESGDASRQLWLVDQVYTIISTYDPVVSSSQSDIFLESGIYLIERGLWADFMSKLQNICKCVHSETKINLYAILLMALTHRKMGMLIEAERAYCAIRKDSDKLGKFKDLFLYYDAHTQHLLGKYAEAQAVYKKLSNSQTRLGNIVPAFDLARRQSADILLIKGRFRSALSTFTKLAEIDHYGEIWKSECLRFCGHVYRFNYDYETAIEYYLLAEKLAVKIGADAMLGKVKTNLLETICWTNPAEAVKLSTEAIELNTDVNSPIELGKCYAAAGLAKAFIGLQKEACEDSDRAVVIQKRTGYLSGQLFSLNTKVISYLFLQKKDEAEEIINRMQEIITEIGVYGFYTHHLFIALLSNKENHLNKIEWLDYKRTESSIQEILLSRLEHGVKNA